MNGPFKFLSILVLVLSAQLVIGCTGLSSTVTLTTLTPDPQAKPAPNLVVQEVPAPSEPYPGQADAQETIDTGQAQLLELGRRATVVSMERTQTAHASALATQDFNQRQQVDLDYQATVVSLHITQAAASQEVFARQTQSVLDAAVAAQDRADAAIRSTEQIRATQTAQSIVNWNAAATQAQSIRVMAARQAANDSATKTVYPTTATPFAATRAALILLQYDREQQAFMDKVVAPLIPFIALINLVLVLSAIAWVYWKVWPRLRARRLRAVHVIGHSAPGLVIEGSVVVKDAWMSQVIPHETRSADENAASVAAGPNVEFLSATEPPVAQWIADVEDQLATGREKGL